jgi:hypothetical protein
MLKAILAFSLASFVASDLGGSIDWAFLKYQVLTLSITDPAGKLFIFYLNKLKYFQATNFTVPADQIEFPFDYQRESDGVGMYCQTGKCNGAQSNLNVVLRYFQEAWAENTYTNGFQNFLFHINFFLFF